MYMKITSWILDLNVEGINEIGALFFFHLLE